MDLTPEQINSYRAERRAASVALLAKITAHLQAGGRVVIATYSHATVYDRRHIAMMRVGKDGGFYTQHGKHWLDSSYSAVRFCT